MKSLRLLDRRAGYSLASIILLLGMVVPAALPAFASAAAIVTSRSAQLSSSAAGATNVTYNVTFTPATTETGGYVVLWFCNNSPIIGQSCTAPTGFSVTSATLGTGSDAGATITGTRVANALEINDSTTGLTSGTAAHFVLQGVSNPTNPTDGSGTNGLYMRIQTYASSTTASTGYASAGAQSGVIDQGGVAMSITSSIGVSATVQETMTFCVAGAGTSMNANGPSGNCGADATGGTATTLDTADIPLVLGHGTPATLDNSAVNTGKDWAQISTNAASGAIVDMTDTNGGNCNGLFRAGATGCDIAGVGSTAAAITAGQALFGMSLGTPVAAPYSVATPTGTITPLAPYTGAGSTYGMGTGVTSTYGDPVFNTAGAPIANENVELTFAASAAPTTPAGVYNATMNLIATGTF